MPNLLSRLSDTSSSFPLVLSSLRRSCLHQESFKPAAQAAQGQPPSAPGGSSSVGSLAPVSLPRFSGRNEAHVPELPQEGNQEADTFHVWGLLHSTSNSCWVWPDLAHKVHKNMGCPWFRAACERLVFVFCLRGSASLLPWSVLASCFALAWSSSLHWVVGVSFQFGKRCHLALEVCSLIISGVAFPQMPLTLGHWFRMKATGLAVQALLSQCPAYLF